MLFVKSVRAMLSDHVHHVIHLIVDQKTRRKKKKKNWYYYNFTSSPSALTYDSLVYACHLCHFVYDISFVTVLSTTNSIYLGKLRVTRYSHHAVPRVVSGNNAQNETRLMLP